MKKGLVIAVFVIILAAGVYIGRKAMKSNFGNTAPQTSVSNNTPAQANSAMAPTNNIYLVKTAPAKGQYLTDFQGMTLYTFDQDTSGVSNCNGGCLTAWPVYTSGATAQGTFPPSINVITRSDGTKQFAWKNKPLYYFAQDKKQGDLFGDGVGGVWHIVTP